MIRFARRWYSTPVFHVAVVGTGPAGFYTAHHLLAKACPRTQFRLQVDFFERNPAPYGLSRYGVAPDHPEVKNCEEYLDNMMERYGAASAGHRVRFFGNVDVGSDLSLAKLQRHYHSVVLAYGCTNSDNRLGVPGESLQNVISARQFVNWYNAALPPPPAPDATDIGASLAAVDTVTIVGNGNVALDVARVLLAPTLHWAPTDILALALAALRHSAVKRVNIVARRGVLELAFSNKEIRELLQLSTPDNGIEFEPVQERLLAAIRPRAKLLSRIDKRKFGLLDQYSRAQRRPLPRSWSLQYLQSPLEFISSDGVRVLHTRLSCNHLDTDSLTHRTKVHPTGESRIIANELVILLIGYQGTPLRGFDELDISFERNRILNQEGRILSRLAAAEENLHNLVYVPGWYTSGWIKNGPQGVIATTMMESFETANSVLEDLSNHVTTAGDLALKSGLQPQSSVSWHDWQRIDAEERRLGEAAGRPRTKLESRRQMLQIAGIAL